MKQVLEAQEIVKVFEEGAQRVEVLKGVSMQVALGEVVALEGPSGSGKTTLLSILGCILTPTSGGLTIAGESISSGKPEQLRDVLLDARELVDGQIVRRECESLDGRLQVFSDQLAIEPRVRVERGGVDRLDGREKLALVTVALLDRLERQIGPPVVVAGIADVGRKLRE